VAARLSQGYNNHESVFDLADRRSVVGLLYSVMEVKSPAPPTVALVGLLGMLGGEHLIPVVRTWLASGIH
jgi:XapX domain-containing protein